MTNPARATSSARDDMIARRRAALGPAYRLTYQNPLHIVRGEGVWLYDADGQAYLDAYNNVPCVGHCHPRMVAALSKQAAVLNTHTRYLHDNVIDYAERLLATFPSGIGHVMFTCTGSEANDLAYRIAQYHTKNKGFIITDHAYHGGTKVIAELSPSLGDVVMTGENVFVVPAPDSYRGLDLSFAANVEKAIHTMMQKGMKPAALIVDTVFASDGVFTDPAQFLAPAVEAVRRAGGLFIADEVQAGFGRTGTHMWGFARHGIVPDIVTMGKSMGAGHPMAGVALKPHLVEDFGRHSRYFNTFGGNPVSAAVGMAVLDVIEDEKLMQNAQETGDALRAGIRQLAEKHAIIGDVRGAGHFTGVELVTDRELKTPATDIAARAINAMRDKRILISSAGAHSNILKIRPPLPFAAEHADMFVSALDDVLSAL